MEAVHVRRHSSTCLRGWKKTNISQCGNVQRTKRDGGEAEEEAAEGPSNDELKKEVEGILDSAGADFSMKDLLAKLRASLLILPSLPPLCLKASPVLGSQTGR